MRDPRSGRADKRLLTWRKSIRAASWVLGVLLLLAGLAFVVSDTSAYRNSRPTIARHDTVLPERKARKALPVFTNRMLNLTREAQVSTSSSFVRTWRGSGRSYCNEIGKSGFATGAWTPTEIDQLIFECNADGTPAGSAGLAPGLLFLSIRGDPHGTVTSVRVKIGGGRVEALQALNQGLGFFLCEEGWNDLNSALLALQQDRELDETRFGIRLQLRRELTQRTRYNLLITTVSRSDAEARTRRFFDRDSWLELEPITSIQRLTDVRPCTR